MGPFFDFPRGSPRVTPRMWCLLSVRLVQREGLCGFIFCPFETDWTVVEEAFTCRRSSQLDGFFKRRLFPLWFRTFILFPTFGVETRGNLHPLISSYRLSF